MFVVDVKDSYPGWSVRMRYPCRIIHFISKRFRKLFVCWEDTAEHGQSHQNNLWYNACCLTSTVQEILQGRFGTQGHHTRNLKKRGISSLIIPSPGSKSSGLPILTYMAPIWVVQGIPMGERVKPYPHGASKVLPTWGVSTSRNFSQRIQESGEKNFYLFPIHPSE